MNPVVEVSYAQRRVLSRTRDSVHLRYRRADFADSKSFPTLPATKLKCDIGDHWHPASPDYFFLSPIKHLALCAIMAVLLIGCSRRQPEISDHDRLTRIADDAAALKRHGFEEVTISDNCVVSWRRGHMGGAAFPTMFTLEPGEMIKLEIPDGTFNGGNKE